MHFYKLTQPCRIDPFGLKLAADDFARGVSAYACSNQGMSAKPGDGDRRSRRRPSAHITTALRIDLAWLLGDVVEGEDGIL